MKTLSFLWFLVTSASALTVQTSLPMNGFFSLNVSYIPTAEPITALHLRIYLKPSSTITSLSLEPNALNVWKQIPPSMKRVGPVLDVVALAPNHMSLSLNSSQSIFSLAIQLGSLDTISVIDSIKVLQALDVNAKSLSLPLKIESIPAGTKLLAKNTPLFSIRQIDRIHEILFFLSKPLMVQGRVLDTQGRVIRLLQSGQLPVGRHRLEWDGRDASKSLVPKGNYILELKMGPNTYHKQVRHVL